MRPGAVASSVIQAQSLVLLISLCKGHILAMDFSVLPLKFSVMTLGDSWTFGLFDMIKLSHGNCKTVTTAKVN